MKTKPEILMVDDNPADIDLTSEVLAQSEGHFHVNAVNDGAEAISFLRRQGKYAKRPRPARNNRPQRGRRCEEVRVISRKLDNV